MDSSFIFSITACFASLLYVCTLFLTLQFRGDFGLIAESGEEDFNSNKLQSNNISMNSNLNYRQKNKNNNYENQNNLSNNGSINSTSENFVNTTIGFLDIPMADLNILFSSISNSNGAYGNKMNNLKVSLKDV